MGIKRVAVVGGGISGIASFWNLQDDFDELHLFEGEPRLGGHANTAIFKGYDGCNANVDTGFIALNKHSYPNFCAFLGSLNVPTIPTEMSLSVSQDDGAFSWCSKSISSFLFQGSNLFKPFFWRIIFDIFRFNYFATDSLSHNSDEKRSTHQQEKPRRHSESSHCSDEDEYIGEYLDRKGYSESFKNKYLIPMVAAPWCIDPKEFCCNFPARSLIRFMRDHQLLETTGKMLKWHTVQHGSKSYVDAFTRKIPSRHSVHLNTPIKSLSRLPDGRVVLETVGGTQEVFDHVILSAHANQSLQILGDHATPLEKEILSVFQTSRNTCILHSDSSLLPKHPAAQAAWNYVQSLSRTEKNLKEKVSVTFDMNKLQQIPFPGESRSPGRVLVSMNPITYPDPSTVQNTFIYDHPLFDANTLRAQKRIHEINGVHSVSFAGAWQGYGFHEDGFVSGMMAANSVLQKAGQRVVAIEPSQIVCDRPASWTVWDRICRLAISSIQAVIDYSSYSKDYSVI